MLVPTSMAMAVGGSAYELRSVKLGAFLLGGGDACVACVWVMMLGAGAASSLVLRLFTVVGIVVVGCVGCLAYYLPNTQYTEWHACAVA